MRCSRVWVEFALGYRRARGVAMQRGPVAVLPCRLVLVQVAQRTVDLWPGERDLVHGHRDNQLIDGKDAKREKVIQLRTGC